MDIIAAVAREAKGTFSIETVQIAPPQPHEVRVRIVGVGLCHTDLVARDQFIPIPLPAVLGHEGAGIVEVVGEEVTKVKVGDAVIIGFNSCGQCARCNEQRPSYCREFPQLNYSGAKPDGSTGLSIDDVPIAASFFGQSSFATHALANENNIIPVDSEGIALETLGPLACGFQTGAGAIMRSLACTPGSSLAIFGGGPVGQAAVMAAVVRGCSPIILIEPLAARREMALKLGATHVINPSEGDVTGAIRSIVADGLDFALETSGREAVVEAALASLASRGMLGLVGVPPKPESSLAINLASVITFGHRVVGIMEGDTDLHGFIPELITLHRNGQFPFDRLIQTFPLDQINEAVSAQHDGLCIKAVLIP